MERDRFNTTIRLTTEERKDVEGMMKDYGFTQISPFIRYAIRQLKATRYEARG